MTLLTKELTLKLLENGRSDGEDHEPVVKLFNPTGAATGLITEMLDDGDTLFGLCDLGFGEPELGYVSLSEIQSVKGRFGVGIERDLHFRADKPISKYVVEARRERRIIA